MTDPETPIERGDAEPELYEALGRVVVVWSSIEAIVAEWLAYMLEANPGNMYVFSQTSSVEAQLKWIRILAGLKFTHPNTTEKLADLFKRLDEAREDRNAYVHGVWNTLCEPGTVLIQSVRLSRVEIVRQELATRSDFDDLLIRLEDIRTELLYLGNALGFLPSGVSD